MISYFTFLQFIKIGSMKLQRKLHLAVGAGFRCHFQGISHSQRETLVFLGSISSPPFPPPPCTTSK